jgi:hypothetical protein
MPGTVLKVIPKTKYDFGSQALGTSQTLTVARHLDCANYRELTLVVRVHSCTTTDTGQISVIVVAEAPTTEDPAFDTVVAGSHVASLSFTSTPAAPKLMLAISSSIPSGSKVVVQVSCSTSTGVGGPNNATISADLVLKS